MNVLDSYVDFPSVSVVLAHMFQNAVSVSNRNQEQQDVIINVCRSSCKTLLSTNFSKNYIYEISHKICQVEVVLFCAERWTR
jgi:hypothetical protein